MIYPENEQSLQRLLGVTSIPEKVRVECELRTNMYHRDANSGPLPSTALIDLIRFCGFAPAQAKAVETKTDWRAFPQDGSVHVEALFMGQWMPGVFRGFVSAGSLDIQMHDGVHKECYPHMIRLVPDYKDRMAYAQLPKDEGPDARASLLDHQDDGQSLGSIPRTEAVEPVSAAHAATEVPDLQDNFTDTVSVDYEDDGPDDDKPFDWKTAQNGDPVWVTLPDKRVVEGKISSRTKEMVRFRVRTKEDGNRWRDAKDCTYGRVLTQQGG